MRTRIVPPPFAFVSPYATAPTPTNQLFFAQGESTKEPKPNLFSSRVRSFVPRTEYFPITMHYSPLSRTSLRKATPLVLRRSRQLVHDLLQQQPSVGARGYSSPARRSARRGRPTRKQSRFSSQAVVPGESLAASQSTSSSGANSSLNAAATEQQLSWQAIRALFVASAVPMVGFGFMDNLVSRYCLRVYCVH